MFYFLILWFQTSVAFIGFMGSHLQKRRLLGKQTNHNKQSLFLNVAVTRTMCVRLWATGKTAVRSPKPHGFILTRTSWRRPGCMWLLISFPALNASVCIHPHLSENGSFPSETWQVSAGGLWVKSVGVIANWVHQQDACGHRKMKPSPGNHQT